MNKAKNKGTKFEHQIACYLAENLDPEIIREPLHGGNDVGDIHGVKLNGRTVVVECKCHKGLHLSQWLGETEREMEAAKTNMGVVVHKRRGCGEANLGDTYVTCTLDTFVNMINRATER